MGLRATTALRSGPRLAPRAEVAAKSVAPLNCDDNPATGSNRTRQNRPSEQETIGYFVNWDEASFSSLKANLDALDLLVPEWLHVYGPDGSWKKTMPSLSAPSSNTSEKIVPRFASCHWSTTGMATTFDSQNLVRVLGDKALRTAAIDRMLKYVKDHAFAGLTIDFEGLPDSSRASFHAFLEELGARLHAAKPAAFD